MPAGAGPRASFARQRKRAKLAREAYLIESHLVAKEFVSKGNDLPYLVQTGSELTINGSKMRSRSRNKQSELFKRLRKGLSVK